MKQSLISLTVCACALSALNANARVDVYQKDALTFGIGGDFQVQYRKRVDTDKNAEIEYDDAELHFFSEYDFDSVTAFARMDLDFKSEINSGDSQDNLDVFKLGLDWGAFKLGFGKLDYATDDVWTHSYDYEMGGNDAFDADSGEDMIFAEANLGPAQLHLSTDLEQGDDGEAKDEKSLDAVLVFDFEPFEIALAYQDFTDSQEFIEDDDGEPTGVLSNPESVDTAGIRLGGEFAGVDTFISYSTNDAADHIQTGAKFKVADPVTLAFGYEMVDADSGDTDIWYANATYAFNSKVKLFAELGEEDEDGAESDLGWLTGLRIRF